jgi:Flp pilus assembly protein TadG
MKTNRLHNESGQVLVLAALCLTCLLGFVAVSVDVGLLFRAKRVVQTAADSAAIAGAAELNFGDVTAAAKLDAGENGVTDGVGGATVTVTQPKAGYVQVVASQPQSTFFMNVFGQSSMAVSATAVAAAVPSPSCVVTLSSTPPGGSGVEITGSAFLTLTTCGLVDNATGSSSLHVTGGAGMSAASIGLVGTANLHNGASVTPTPVGNISPVSDPLSSIVTPPPASDYSSGCVADPKLTKSATIGPSSPSGYVCYSGFSISKGSPTITLNPGLYIFNGGAFNIASGTIMNGTGVTFYFVNGASFAISNGAALTVSAPTSGSYSGILFYQNPSDTAADSFIGGSAGSLSGIFYLPAAQLTLANGNTSTFSTDLVVGSLIMSGAATLQPYKPLTGASPLSVPRLVQ